MVSTRQLRASEEKRRGLHTTEDPATAPNPTHSTAEAVAPIGGHGCLDHFQRLHGKGWMLVDDLAQRAALKSSGRKL